MSKAKWWRGNYARQAIVTALRTDSRSFSTSVAANRTTRADWLAVIPPCDEVVGRGTIEQSEMVEG